MNAKLYLYTLSMATLLTGPVIAQPSSILERSIAFECRDQPLGQVLDGIARKGGFYFSYVGTLLNKDSIVTIPLQRRTIRQTLDLLFKDKLQYSENGRYLILQPASQKNTRQDNRLTLTGTILDERTGEKVVNASVYVPVQLVATLSRKDGSFTVRLRNKGWPIVLTVSKDAYIDTIIRLGPENSRDLTITILPDASPPKASLFSPADASPDDSVTVQWQADSVLIRTLGSRDLVQGVEITGFGKFLLSYRLRMQSLNLKKYFVQRPVQISFIPGLSTNGRLNSQVTNKFSLNVIGGYAAGLNGVELGGVFNIDRMKIKGVQAAGVVNMVGGTVSGVQLAGAVNADLDSMTGLQMAGAVNRARYVRGVQYSGGLNLANRVDGVQSGLVNITRRLKGVQIGLVNFADTSEGCSFGIINIIRHGGMHELSVYADEFSPLNVAFRSGRPAFYNIYLVGVNPDYYSRSYSFGWGFGHQFPLTSATALRAEFTLAHVSPVNLHFSSNTMVFHANLDFHWQVAKGFGLTAGPSLAFYNPDGNYSINGQPYHPLPNGYHTHTIKGGELVWIGWRAAIDLF